MSDNRKSEPPFTVKKSELKFPTQPDSNWLIIDKNGRSCAVGGNCISRFTEDQARRLCDMLNEDHHGRE